MRLLFSFQRPKFFAATDLTNYMIHSTVSTSFFQLKIFFFRTASDSPALSESPSFYQNRYCLSTFFFQQHLCDNCFAASPVISGSPSFYQIPCCLSIFFFTCFAFPANSSSALVPCCARGVFITNPQRYVKPFCHFFCTKYYFIYSQPGDLQKQLSDEYPFVRVVVVRNY